MCFQGDGIVWTYVRPVERFIPARMVETRTQLAHIDAGDEEGLLRTASKA